MSARASCAVSPSRIQPSRKAGIRRPAFGSGLHVEIEPHRTTTALGNLAHDWFLNEGLPTSQGRRRSRPDDIYTFNSPQPTSQAGAGRRLVQGQVAENEALYDIPLYATLSGLGMCPVQPAKPSIAPTATRARLSRLRRALRRRSQIQGHYFLAT
jgi:hypothetical protein